MMLIFISSVIIISIIFFFFSFPPPHPSDDSGLPIPSAAAGCFVWRASERGAREVVDGRSTNEAQPTVQTPCSSFPSFISLLLFTSPFNLDEWKRRQRCRMEHLHKRRCIRLRGKALVIRFLFFWRNCDVRTTTNERTNERRNDASSTALGSNSHRVFTFPRRRSRIDS